MTLIISSGDGEANRVDPSGFDYEDRLQEYIKSHPESIPLYEVKEDINLLVLAREFSTNSGPIDALAVDEDGDLYVIETKLYNNGDKRKVLAQALDYGAALWKHAGNFTDFKEHLNTYAQKAWKMNVEDKLSEYFALDEDELNALLERIEENLDDGILKYVVLMDSLDDRLKDLVIYVNQNSQFDVYAVEMKHYEHEQYDIMLPRLFGAEVKKDIEVSSNSPRRSSAWSKEELIEEASKNFSDTVTKNFKKFYSFAEEYADEIRRGKGKTYGSFGPVILGISTRTMFTMRTNGLLSLNFKGIKEAESNMSEEQKSALRDTYFEKIKEIGLNIKEEDKEKYPTFEEGEWSPKTDEILATLHELVDQSISSE